MNDKLYSSLLEGNKNWVRKMLDSDPEFFKDLAKGQQPPVLWIGCSDSRVPANEITGTKPGEIFVHRNIANMVIHNDLNMLSVLDYAVNVLKVQHVIVCGHYGCGGVLAAMQDKQFGLIDYWLKYIKDVYRIHHEELEAISDEHERARRMVDLNVTHQVYHLCETPIIQNAWKNNGKQTPQVHGWVYDIGVGLIHDLEVNTNRERVGAE
jgi:carbonic anhydrase